MYTVIEDALVYDLFPQSINKQELQEREGDGEGSFVIIVEDSYTFVSGDSIDRTKFEYYGRALVGNSHADVIQPAAYTYISDELLEGDYPNQSTSACVESCYNGCVFAESCSDCVDAVDLTATTIDTILALRELMGNLEEVMMKFEAGGENPLLVPTISRNAAEGLYSRLIDIHDNLAATISTEI